jgi:hypothetical protein
MESKVKSTFKWKAQNKVWLDLQISESLALVYKAMILDKISKGKHAGKNVRI